MKNKTMLFEEFVNENIFQKIADIQIQNTIKRYAKLAFLADLLLKDINSIVKVEKNRIAKKIVLTSHRFVNFLKQTHQQLAKITKEHLNLKTKTIIDSNNFLIEVKNLKNQRKNSYFKYVKDIATYREDSLKQIKDIKKRKKVKPKEDDMVKHVLKLYNRIKPGD